MSGTEDIATNSLESSLDFLLYYPPVLASIISSDGEYLYTSESAIYQISMTSQNLISKFGQDSLASRITVLDLSYDDLLIASITETCEVKVFEIESKKLLMKFHCLEWNPVILKFLRNSRNHLLIGFYDISVEIWDVMSGLLQRFEYLDVLTSIAICEERHKMWVVGESYLTVYDLRTGHKEEIKEFVQEYAVALSNDQSFLVMGNWRGRFSILYIHTKESVHLYESDGEGWIYQISISHNDQFAASCGLSEYVYIWDLKARKFLLKFLRKSSRNIKFLLFCIQNKYFISCFENIFVSIWDLTTGEQRIIGKHNSMIDNARMTERKDKFVTCAKDGIFLWDGVIFECLGRISGHSMPIIGAINDKSKEFLITSGQDKTIRFWNIPKKKEVKVYSSIEQLYGLKLVYNKYLVGSTKLTLVIFNYIT